jgi:TonB family protein
VAVRPTLTPSSAFVMTLGTGGVEEPTRGTTVKNGPGEQPDPDVAREYTGEVLTRKLNSQLREDVGLAAVEAGNVPTHFKRYESAMRKALPKAKIDKTPMTGKEALGEVAGMMFNNGPSAAAQKKIADSPTGRSVLNQTVMMPNVDDQRSREGAMAMLSQTEAIKERIGRPRLRTVLEVTTDASGALADVSIVEKSGDPRFDESVVHFSRKVARTIPDSDDKLLGASMWRTRWQFTWEPPDVRVRLLNAWRVAE